MKKKSDNSFNPQERFSIDYKQIWKHKKQLLLFVWSDINKKYNQPLMGVICMVIGPLVMVLLFTLIFGKILKMPTENLPYLIFAYSGLLIWNIFSSGLSRGVNSLVDNVVLIKIGSFPLIIPPISSIFTALLDFLVSCFIFVGLLIYFDCIVDLYKMLIFIPLAVLLTIITTLGLSLLLITLNGKYPNIKYRLPYLITFLLIVSPVIYPTSILKAKWLQYLTALNPLSGAINMFRYSLIDKPFQIDIILISIFSAIILFFFGIYFFLKAGAYSIDDITSY